MTTIRLLVVAALLACWTGAAAQKVLITAPATLETYARDDEYISVVNEGIQDMKGTLTLVLDGGRAPISLGTITVPENAAVRQRVTFPDTLDLRANLLSPRPLYQGRDNVFRGHVQLVSTGTKTGSDGQRTTFVNTVPITINGFGHLLLFSNFYMLIVFPIVLTPLLLLLAWFGSAQPKMTEQVTIQTLLPDPTYVTNFSLFGALAASGASLIALDAPNKVTAGLVGALSVIILALAPLLFTFGQRDTTVPTDVPGPNLKGTIDKEGNIDLHAVMVEAQTPGKTASVGWYLLIMALTVYGASLAMTLAFLVIPRTIDVYRSANVTGVTVLDYALRGTLLAIGVAFMFFSRRVIITALSKKQARLI